MDGQLAGQVNKQMCEWIDRWMDGEMDGLMGTYIQINRWIGSIANKIKY